MDALLKESVIKTPEDEATLQGATNSHRPDTHSHVRRIQRHRLADTYRPGRNSSRKNANQDACRNDAHRPSARARTNTDRVRKWPKKQPKNKPFILAARNLNMQMPANEIPPQSYWLVPQAHWKKIDEFLSARKLQYEHFHTSFVSACNRLIRRINNGTTKNLEQWELQVRDLLREYPVPAQKYIEALQLYKDACGSRLDTIMANSVQVKDEEKRNRAQAMLYASLFTRKQRQEHAKEKKEVANLALPGLLDALDDIEVSEKKKPSGTINKDRGGDKDIQLELAFEELDMNIE